MNLPNSRLIVTADHKLNESKKRDWYLDIATELKKAIKHESDGNTKCNWYSRYSHQTIAIETGGLKNKRTS